MKLTFDVTSKHIAKGLSANCEECPIALSIAEMGFVEVNANHCTIRFSESHTSPLFSLATTPNEVRNFMDAFDTGKPVEPFSFELELECHCLPM